MTGPYGGLTAAGVWWRHAVRQDNKKVEPPPERKLNFCICGRPACHRMPAGPESKCSCKEYAGTEIERKTERRFMIQTVVIMCKGASTRQEKPPPPLPACFLHPASLFSLNKTAQLLRGRRELPRRVFQPSGAATAVRLSPARRVLHLPRLHQHALQVLHNRSKAGPAAGNAEGERAASIHSIVRGPRFACAGGGRELLPMEQGAEKTDRDGLRGLHMRV